MVGNEGATKKRRAKRHADDNDAAPKRRRKPDGKTSEPPPSVASPKKVDFPPAPCDQNQNEEVDFLRCVAEHLRTDGVELNDTDMHESITGALSPLSSDGAVYISSVNMQNFLSKARRGCYDDGGRAQAIKDLGIPPDRADAKGWKLMLAIVHGPYTENARSCGVYDEGTPDNYHWSLLAWFPDRNHAFHYDSCDGLNNGRCLEILSALRSHGVTGDSVPEVYTPRFIPRQGDVWECGLFALIFFKILNDKTAAGYPEPITEEDVRMCFPADGTWKRSVVPFILDCIQKRANQLLYP